MRPTIEWVNHASFILHAGNTHLLSDPWLEGRVFAESWDLLSPTVFTYEDFARITHIWFSHEHPDHFSPPNLKKIPPEHRAKITVLYQRTADKKLVKFCQSLGFQAVHELPSGEWTALSPNLSVCCMPVGGIGDSLLAMRAGDDMILNLNDCLMDESEAKALLRVIGQPTVLLTQFSYAQWEGNPDDRLAREAAAQRKLEQVELRLRVFQPETIIPQASFVWFCHEQNQYMNDAVNTVGQVARWLSDYPVRTVVLYPGHAWTIGAYHDPRSALSLYASDYAAISTRADLTVAKSIDPARLEKSASEFRRKVLAKIGWYEFATVKPLHVYLSDFKRSARFSILKGWAWTDTPEHGCDVAMSSDAVLYGMDLAWGFNTIEVSGRLHIRNAASRRIFQRYAFAGEMMNHQVIAYQSFIGRSVNLASRVRKNPTVLFTVVAHRLKPKAMATSSSAS